MGTRRVIARIKPSEKLVHDQVNTELLAFFKERSVSPAREGVTV